MTPLEKLIKEYRPSMDAEVLHSWAAEVVASLSPAIPGKGMEPVAWMFELAQGHDSVAGYCDWGPPKVAFAQPSVPVGSIRNLVPLYATPPAEAAPVGVKALEWNPFRAETPFGYYNIDDQTDRPDELKGRSPFLLSGSRLDLSRHPTLTAARAAAQSDFEARLLSCIDIPAKADTDAIEAVNDIAAERRRQIEAEGWTPEHDDAHTKGEMTERVAKAICKSKSCEGFMCCQHPANLGRIECPVKAGGYDDAARAAIEAMRNPGMDALDAMNDIAIDGPGYVSFYPSLHDCALLFNAGIDAALDATPTPKGQAVRR